MSGLSHILLRDGHSGHLRPALDYLQGLLFRLGLHWQLGAARSWFAAQAAQRRFSGTWANEYPRSESNRHWGPF